MIALIGAGHSHRRRSWRSTLGTAWCRVAHWRIWRDVSSGRPDPGWDSGVTILCCGRCARRYAVPVLRYARAVTQTPAR
jgi:hypothetical protein